MAAAGRRARRSAARAAAGGLAAGLALAGAAEAGREERRGREVEVTFHAAPETRTSRQLLFFGGGDDGDYAAYGDGPGVVELRPGVEQGFRVENLDDDYSSGSAVGSIVGGLIEAGGSLIGSFIDEAEDEQAYEPSVSFFDVDEEFLKEFEDEFEDEEPSSSGLQGASLSELQAELQRRQEEEEEGSPAQACGSEGADERCCDAPPPDFTCRQQVEWGKCAEDWFVEGGYCAFSCGFCEVETEAEKAEADEAEAEETEAEEAEAEEAEAKEAEAEAETP